MGRDSLMVVGILVVVTGSMMAFVYLPQQRRMEDIRTRIATQKETLKSDVQKASVLPDMIRQVREMKERYRDVNRKVPARTELGGFLREISGNLAVESLTNQLIEPGNPAHEELFNTLPIIMKFRGSYLALASFLTRMDKMERLARVQKLGIDSDSKSSDLNIEVQMNIYFTDRDG